MNPTDNTKKSPKLAWPGREAAFRRVVIIALVLFPCTWIVTALLVGNWNLLADQNEEAWRHLREATVVFVCTVCILFLISLLPSTQRFSRWIFSWRAIRRCLIVLAWGVTLTALFYGEEDWRGSHDWNKYSDVLKAQGEQLDLKAYIPKPIPDAENFAATPEIQSWFIHYTNAAPPGFSNSWATDDFGRANAMMSSSASDTPRHLADLVRWQTAFAAVRAGNTNSGQTFKSDNFDPEARAEAARSILEALKPVEARMEELRTVSTRTGAYYPVVYDLNNPWGILLPHVVNIKNVCLHLDLRACAELATGQSDRALADVKLILRTSDSLKSETFLISYLVRISTFHLAVHSIWEGLAEHRWSDAQLKELQDLLARYDFIADLKPPLDGERAAGILTADLLAERKVTLNELTGDPSSAGRMAANAFGIMIPHGWYEMEKLNYCRLYNLQLEGTFDVSAKKVFPEKVASNTKALERALAGRNLVTTILIRHQLLAVIMLPALGNVPRKGALVQVTANQAMLACALERYRLAHGQFPDRLEALLPEFIATMPLDVITGQAYKFRRTTDSFVLYSVGWNETDDGGEVVMKGRNTDPTEGDWVWDYPTK